jgi:hypothetical protein
MDKKVITIQIMDTDTTKICFLTKGANNKLDMIDFYSTKDKDTKWK